MAKDNKVKKVKTRDTGFNIAYRIVTALIAAATFPVMFFTSLFYLAYTIPLISLIGGDSSDTGATYFDASIYKFLTDYASMFKGSSFDLTSVLEPLKKPLTVVICLYAAVAVLALVIILLAAFTRKKLPIIITSAVGSGVLLAIPFAFNALEKPLIDGTITLDSFLKLGLPSLSSLIVTVDFLRAGNAYTLLWVIFAAILIWTGAVMLVSIGDKPNKNA